LAGRARELLRRRRQGLRPFVVGALAELTITVVTLGLVFGASAVFKI